MGTTNEGRAPEPSDAGYANIEHTADVGVRAWGPTPAAAFAAVARGMYTIALDRDPARCTGPAIARTVTVEGDTWPDLLVNWLAELLFFFSVDGLVVREFDIAECVPPHCSAAVSGVVLEDDGEVQGVEIKAVTYHKLDVAVAPGRTTIRVLFDI